MRQIYLDYNATTPIAPSVFEAMRPFLTDHFGNPSSRHSFGSAAHQAVEGSRLQLAELLGCRDDEIVFTGGGTESNNLAILGCLANDSGYSGHLVISAVEHPAVSAPARFAERNGCQVTIVPTDHAGCVNPVAVERAIRDDTKLVSIMHANNEIGALQPISEISRVCRKHHVLLHTDAAQTIGKVRTHVDELGVDLLTVAGHKMYAPKGVGALYVRHGTLLRPVIHGAGHEFGLRPGTENVASIVALGHAAKLAIRSIDENQQRIAGLRNRLLEMLQVGVGQQLSINGDLKRCLPNTLSVNFPEITGQALLDHAADVCASTGSACHSGSLQLSDTLNAIGLSPEVARGTVRLSLGWNTSVDDIERASSSLLSAWDSLRRG